MLVILSGVSGAGKDTIKKELIIDKNKRDIYTETLEQESGLNRPNWLKYFE